MELLSSKARSKVESRFAEPLIGTRRSPMTLVDQCPFRDQVQEKKGAEFAYCRLLREISGVEKPTLCRVRRDVCGACCQSFPPSQSEINPIIASMLYQLTTRVIARGGVDGCPAGKATALQSWAQVNLEVEPGYGDMSRPPERASRTCCYLGPRKGFRTLDGDGLVQLPVFECKHPNHEKTTPAECARCRDWAAEIGPAPRPIEQLVPPPIRRRDPRIRRWAVGVTTAPRRQPTLALCLDSLMRAGWDEGMPPRLFVDSPVTFPEAHADLPITLHESKIGAWPNYYLALMELLMRDPEADAFLLVQDDAIFYDRQNLRQHLEQILWPAGKLGLVSLYCSKAYSRQKPGWHKKKGNWSWGALAFVFPRELAKRFVCDPIVLDHRWRGPRTGLAIIDFVIGAWASRHNVPIYYPCPSLVQHIGDTSTLWPHERAADIRRADRFAGDMV